MNSNDDISQQSQAHRDANEEPAPQLQRHSSTVSLRALCAVLVRRRRLFLSIEGGLLLLCLLYCLIAPNSYEATARVQLRTTPATPLGAEGAAAMASASILSAPLTLETISGVLRSEQLAWRVTTTLKLYQEPGFAGSFASRYPGFRADAPSPEAEAWLIERFSRRLNVQTIPRTLFIEIRFRTHNAVLSEKVVNELINAYDAQLIEGQLQATADASGWLNKQLADMKANFDRDQQKLAEFENSHAIVGHAGASGNGQPSEGSSVVQMDELSRQLVAATSERILAEAEYRAASQGDPETVIAGDPRLQDGSGGFATALLQQIRTRESDLEEEQARLSAEHGPNFPRVVEIGRQLEDLDRQKKAEDAKLVDRFHSSLVTAQDREQLVRNSLQQTTGEGLKLNQANIEYETMRQEAEASHELYLRVLEKVEEAGLMAGTHGSDISVVDPARQPVKPVSPNLPLYLAITFFAGLWLATGGVLMAESLSEQKAEKTGSGARAIVLFLAALAVSSAAHAQLPSPATTGLPPGVSPTPQTPDTRIAPNAREAPTVWGGAAANVAGMPAAGQPAGTLGAPMPAPIAPGDLLDISEYHTPEFHTDTRVSAAGTVTLPMIDEVQIGGMDEKAAAHAIEAALAAKGMLLHPLVSVMVTAYAGQDVSVLGEVTRPGVYPFTYHHRLLDFISAASGLSPNAGRLVNVFHANDSKTAHPIVLDPSGTDTAADHNPELSPGDTVQVSRAGLVYVVGDVIRPGGFAVDPTQGLTVVQALTLAWGPSQNAATGNAVLIREQKGGRTLTTLNLKRMLHGQDPDQPIQDRDILYIPDSEAKYLWNRTLEAAIQSTLGVTIYSALVYSSRY